MSIEVEQKLIISPQEEACLIARAMRKGEKTFTDTYYDTLSFECTTRDMWLRKRGAAWELKIPVARKEPGTQTQYREITEEKDIVTALGLDPQLGCEVALAHYGYIPFATLTTTRTTYTKQGLSIDIDYVDFGYRIAEIERMVEHERDIPKAEQAIAELIASCGIAIKPVRGKVIEYIRIHDKRHFDELVRAGTVHPDGTR